jgi:hypothetical protein
MIDCLNVSNLQFVQDILSVHDNELLDSLQGKLVKSQSQYPSVGGRITADGKGDDLDNTLLYAPKGHLVSSTLISQGE